MKCIKCGGENIKLQYEAAIPSSSIMVRKAPFPQGEFMLKICQICGYHWAEETEDSKQSN